MERLDALLSHRGYCYRSRAREFLRAYAVKSGEVRLTDASKRVDEGTITVDGQPIDPPLLWILLHKPLDRICSHKEHGPLIYDLLPDRWLARKPQITSVGRLDRDTTGVLLLSDDGALVHRLTSPKFHIPRVYVADLKRPLSGHEAALFASGTLMLEDDDKPLRPVAMETVSPTRARLTLHEGRYHQVRRMFEAIGNEVTALHREKFGPLGVGELQAGEWRLLGAEEVEELRRATTEVRRPDQ